MTESFGESRRGRVYSAWIVVGVAMLAVGWLVRPRERLGPDGKPMTIGRVRLRTFPTGARVWVDGALKIEATPATLILPEGEHHLVLQLEGGEAMEQTIHVEAASAKDVTIDVPKPREARLSVLSDVVGADVRVNGYRRGATPLVGVVTKPGPLDITVSSADGRAKSVRTSLAIAEQKMIEVFFEPVASEPEARPEPVLESRIPSKSYLTLGLQPEGEVLTLDGARLGTSPLIRLPMEPGTHQLVLRSLDGRYEKRVEVELEPEQAAVFRFMLRDEDQLPGWRPPDAGPRADR